MANKALFGPFSFIGVFAPPMTFPVSGRIVIELPAGFPPDQATSQFTILNNKINYLMSLNPTYTGSFQDELFSDSNIDYANSSKISTCNGSSKNTSVDSGGVLQTNPFVFAPNASSIIIYYEVYTLYNKVYTSDSKPEESLYNFDPISSTFVEPSSSLLICQYSVDGGPFISASSGVEIDLGGVRNGIALKFLNPGNKIFLSSFSILYK
jgi:hypothetical protein